MKELEKRGRGHQLVVAHRQRLVGGLPTTLRD